MTVCGIVAEYNPFHAGHAHHIAETRRILGADAANRVRDERQLCAARRPVCAGKIRPAPKRPCAAGPTLCSRRRSRPACPRRKGSRAGRRRCWTRSAASPTCPSARRPPALPCCGARPVRRAPMSAHGRAAAGAGRRSALRRGHAAGGQRRRPGGRCAARQPDNTLAVEYLRALNVLGSRMQPLAIERQGGAHDSDTPADGLPSASYLRRLLADGQAEACRPLMPAASFAVLQRENAARRGAGHAGRGRSGCARAPAAAGRGRASSLLRRG